MYSYTTVRPHDWFQLGFACIWDRFGWAQIPSDLSRFSLLQAVERLLSQQLESAAKGYSARCFKNNIVWRKTPWLKLPCIRSLLSKLQHGVFDEIKCKVTASFSTVKPHRKLLIIKTEGARAWPFPGLKRAAGWESVQGLQMAKTA